MATTWLFGNTMYKMRCQTNRKNILVFLVHTLLSREGNGVFEGFLVQHSVGRILMVFSVVKKQNTLKAINISPTLNRLTHNPTNTALLCKFHVLLKNVGTQL